MTLIDKAEALRIVMEECYKDREMRLATRIEERIAALPARGVGVPTEAQELVGARKSVIAATDTYNAKWAEAQKRRQEGDWSLKLDAEFIAMEQAKRDFIRAAERFADGRILAALAPTDAAQAREAHLREAASAVRARYMGDNNREDQEVMRCEAAIIALIGDRT